MSGAWEWGRSMTSPFVSSTCGGSPTSRAFSPATSLDVADEPLRTGLLAVASEIDRHVDERPSESAISSPRYTPPG
jgi:hypothetical protein